MFFCNKNVCSILNTAYQIFNVVTKNRCHLWRHTFKKSQKYLYNCKNLKKTFLQLRCSNVLLHLKYKLPLRKPEIEFKNQTGAKALATDHREMVFLVVENEQVVVHSVWLWLILFARDNYKFFLKTTLAIKLVLFDWQGL